MKKTYSFDIETFANTFSLVAKEVGTKNYLDFIIHEDDTLGHAEDLFLWLHEKPKLVGYNNIEFDGQVLEEIWKSKMINGREIYAFAQSIIETKDKFQLPYKQWTFSFKHLDLMALNNFGIFGKPTSLKWLEFTTRQQNVQDLPFHHSTELEPRHFDELLKYNRRDVDMTDKFYDLCKKQIDMRNVLSAKYHDPIIMNQPNSSIGEKIVLYSYCDATGKDKYKIKKKITRRKQIKIVDVILPYIKFETPILQEVKRDFENLVLKAGKGGAIKIKKVYEKEIKFQNMDVTYALGGIHGCVPSGIFHSSDTHIIMTCDVEGMYPNIAISNGFHPKHLGEIFCEVFKNILRERKKYPKATHLELNLAYKEAANSVYGKSNAGRDNFLKDPEYTVKTTVNGQLAVSMLGEQLSEIGEFIMWNTDGIELIIPRDKQDEYYRICEEWCKLTGMNLEHDTYETMWVRDVNNYIAKFTSGKIKRKGDFCVYEDYIGNWSKDPSALIIPEAVQAYFLDGKSPHDTITNWNNIHDFLYGIKGGSTFEYWTLDIENNTIMNIDRHNERALRYYISKEGKSILKHWIDGKKVGDLPSAPPSTKGQMIQPLQNIRDSKGEIMRKRVNILEPAEWEVLENGKRKRIKESVREIVIESRYPDLDYEFYIQQAMRWINEIENGEVKEVLTNVNGLEVEEE